MKVVIEERVVVEERRVVVDAGGPEDELVPGPELERLELLLFPSGWDRTMAPRAETTSTTVSAIERTNFGVKCEVRTAR